MSDIVPAGQQSAFDDIRHVDEQGEFWLARELMTELGYTGKGNWQNFEKVIREAQTVCLSQGYSVAKVFSQITKNPSKGGGRPGTDYRLTRFACYLIALSAEGSIEQVAAAKTYFAVKTRQQETQDAQSATIEAMIARAKARVDAREKLSESYNDLEATAASRGMQGQRNFATLHNNGDLGVYGMSKDALAERHGLMPQHGQRRVNINDHAGTLELGATIMRNGIAGADISQMQRPTNQQMFHANREAGTEIREVLMGHGILPEDLPKEPHISEARQVAQGQIPLSLLPPELEEDDKGE